MTIPTNLREDRVHKPGPHVATAEAPIFDERLLNDQPWIRLAAKKYKSQFYPSPHSRLTPDSWTFPCCYLGVDFMTATAEVFGDRLAARREKKKKILMIPSVEARGMHYLRIDGFPKLALCDLTDSKTRLALQLETGALMTPDISIPQSWAQAIAVHPNLYDGIVYRSRHTDERCVVLWNRKPGRVLEKNLVFRPAGEFYQSPEAYALAKHMGMRLSFVS
jgi:hypothetical protein